MHKPKSNTAVLAVGDGVTSSGGPTATSKLIGSIVAAALVVVATLAIGLSPALAHGPNVNGCTGVPDSGYGFDFHEMCDDHDRCYGAKPYGDGWRGRRSCDREFRSAMLDHCKQHNWFTTKRAACDAVAITYYVGVRAFGWTYWQQAEPTIIA